jgi:hypothetical protein
VVISYGKGIKLLGKDDNETCTGAECALPVQMFGSDTQEASHTSAKGNCSKNRCDDMPPCQ